MKSIKKSFFIVAILSCTQLYSQEEFIMHTYDQSGNRTRRYLSTTGVSLLSEENINEYSLMNTTIDSDIIISHNSTSENVTVRISSFINCQGYITIHNMNGIQILDTVITNEITTVDISSLPPGFYMVFVTINDKYKTYKLIK